MNKHYRFPNNVPTEEDVWLWWDKKTEEWQVWFGDEPPMFEDGEYNRFQEPLFHYKKAKDNG